MSLGSSWWTALGAAARWAADFTGYSGAHADGSGYIQIMFGDFVRCFLAPSSDIAGPSDRGLDSGYLYAVNLYPQVLSFNLTIASGATSAVITNSTWTHLGKIRYRVIKCIDDSVMSTSSYYPSSAAKSYASAITLTGMTAGVDYYLEAWIDAIPNISGYTEGWANMQIIFRCPAAIDKPIAVPAELPAKMYATQVAIFGGEEVGRTVWTIRNPQYVQVTPRCVLRDFEPLDLSDARNSAHLVTPYVLPTSESTFWPAVITFWAGRDGFWDMHHYQPWAYYGTPPAVIAAILMQAGLSASYIDQWLFSDADSAYTSDSPWSGIASVPTIYAARKIGRTVADLIYDVVRHTRDLLAVTMNGKMALISRTRPPTLPALTANDGVVSVEWGWTREHLFNAVTARLAGGFLQYGGTTGLPSSLGGVGSFGCSEEGSLDSYLGDKWDVTCEDTTSQAKYGRVDLPGRKTSTLVSGAIKERTVASYPMWLDVAIGEALLTHWITMDAKPRREVRVRQTFIGLDYDVGTKITAATLTGDGLTISNMFCIEKTIDFDDMRVDSILLEDPSL